MGLADGLVCIGAALAVYGVGLLSVAAGLITAGVVLAGIGVLVAVRHG